jgi:hypothetical protein
MYQVAKSHKFKQLAKFIDPSNSMYIYIHKLQMKLQNANALKKVQQNLPFLKHNKILAFCQNSNIRKTHELTSNDQQKTLVDITCTSTCSNFYTMITSHYSSEKNNARMFWMLVNTIAYKLVEIY